MLSISLSLFEIFCSKSALMLWISLSLFEIFCSKSVLMLSISLSLFEIFCSNSLVLFSFSVVFFSAFEALLSASLNFPSKSAFSDWIFFNSSVILFFSFLIKSNSFSVEDNFSLFSVKLFFVLFKSSLIMDNSLSDLSKADLFLVNSFSKFVILDLRSNNTFPSTFWDFSGFSSILLQSILMTFHLFLICLML